MRERTRLWIGLGLLVLAAALPAQLWLGGRPVTAQPSNAMAVDMNPATPEIDSSATEPLGVPFDVSINVTSDAVEYDTYGFSLVWDPAGISFVSGTHLSPDGFTACFPFASTAGNVATGCGHEPPDTMFAGQMDKLTLQCLASGTYSLHLVTLDEDPVLGTTTYNAFGVVNTALADAQVTCGEGGSPVPTATPVEGTPPTPTTPAGPGGTPTPLPPGTEAVALFPGCQFQAWTGADGTSPGELASRVAPSQNLIALWAQQPAPTWRGYSPQFPEVSDMMPMNTLDVVAICMTGPGDFVRPAI